MKLLSLYGLLALGVSLNLWGDDGLTLDKDYAPSGVTNTSFQLEYDPSDTGNETTTAAVVYLPMTQTSTTNIDHSVLSKLGVTALYDSSSVVQKISYPVVVNVGSTAKYVYAAVKLADETVYKVVARSALLSDRSSEVNYIDLSPYDLCESNTTKCAGVAAGSATQVASPVEAMVFFFLESANWAVDASQPVDPASYTGGVYYKTNLSNKTWTNIHVVIDELRPGDKRLFVKYSSDTTMGTPFIKRAFVFQYTDTSTVQASTSINAAVGVISSKEVGAAQAGEVNLNNLINNRPYNLAMAFQDKYGFATPLSPSLIESPLEISELLKKQACFLLTAGFGEEHYVIDYFRKFRDSTLSQFSWGRKFIAVYYELAPQYALQIYQSESLRFLIRMGAYTLYFIFHHAVGFLLGVGLLVFFLGYCVFISRIRKKIKV